ncbi:MAG: MBL fold metallo-hydrolase [Anaerolineae bacterium]
MIKPTQSSQLLLYDINSTQPSYGQLALWWLGQSGYAIKTASILFYIDLYLSEYLAAKYANTTKPHIRITQSPFQPAEITNAHWVFSSHKHSDHLDPGTLPALFAASPQAKLILPAAVVDHAVTLGLPAERLMPTRGDETFTVGAMTVHSIPSAHPDFDYTEPTGYPFLGFVFQMDGVTLYHACDTLAYAGLAERLQKYDIDVALLPINGGYVPGTAPNMNIADAITLAQQIKPRLVIPNHYDMFTFNTADVSQFISQADSAQLNYRVLHCGEKFILNNFTAE